MEPQLGRILVAQTWGMGDAIMLTPMLAGLCQSLSKAHISIGVGNDAAAELLRDARFGDVVRLPTSQLRKDEVLRRLYRLRDERFDAAMMATGISPWLSVLLRSVTGIPVVAGSSRPVFRRCYTHWRPHRRGEHRVAANVAIARMLVPQLQPGSLYSPLTEDAKARAESLWVKWGLTGRRVVGIHPGSAPADREKRIPLDLSQRIVDRLAQLPDVDVLVLAGPGERDLMGPLVSLCSRPRVTLAHDLPLAVVAGLIGRLAVLVAGHNGLAHLASALNTAVVMLAGPTETERSAPWTSKLNIVAAERPPPCMPCYGTRLYGRCPYGIVCMERITAERVIDAVKSFL